MSNPPKTPISKKGFDNRFKSLTLDDTNNKNKPDSKESHLGSPISPLTTRPSGPTTTSSSSSSSGSVSAANPLPKSHSGELSDRIRGSKPAVSSSGAVNSPSVNLFPTGNICPTGRVPRTGMATLPVSRTEVMGSGTGIYGHGTIMRGSDELLGDELKRALVSLDPEELKRVGNLHYKMRHFGDALLLYDRAISISPKNAQYRSNRAAALTGLGRILEAATECEEAVRLDPGFGRAHHRLASLLIRLGQVEKARRHLSLSGVQSVPTELQIIEKHIKRCADARRIRDWKSALRESDAAISAGADSSPQLFTCRTEALLKLHRIEEAEHSLSNIPKFEHGQSGMLSKFFGMISEAYLVLVQSQIDMSLGRFENAVTAAEKAGQIDPQNPEVSAYLINVKLVARARGRGNDLFKSERFTEACSAYEEGLKIDPSNSVLYCNRAACWYKLGMWERSVDDCNQALRIQPNYTKALLRRASCNTKLERWADSVSDYEVLRRELPSDNDVAEALFHALVALKKSRGEDVSNMTFGGEVEVVSGREQLLAAISSPGVSVVYYKAASNQQCDQISPLVDTLCRRYPTVNFLKVDVLESPEIAKTENVRIVPTFKIYKNKIRVKEMICPSPQVLESSIRHYSI